jgi:hypothetical protein
MKLFGYLPETLFQPLSGPKRHVYARLLMRLYEKIFAARILETPLKEDVLHQIEIALSEEGVRSEDLLQEQEAEGGVSGGEASGQAHYLAYHRLRDTGWLVEERERWRVYVDMNPDAFMVIAAVADFANSRVRVAGAVVEVKSNLEAAMREPEVMAQGLANAHDTAIRFARNMRRILAGMREIEDRILGNPDAASILRTFFQDFVDGLLIADYKQLKTSNNPYRHRRTIGTLAGELLHDADRRAIIARAYLDQGVVPGGSLVAAEERIVSELEKIRSVFEDVGAFMERIEDFRDRLERRVRTTVHYMDVMGEGSAERLARLIEALAGTNQAEVTLRTRSPDVGFPISSMALYTPPPPRAAPEPTRFRRPLPDPYQKAYVAAGNAFDRLIRVSPARLAAFVGAAMDGRDGMTSAEIEIGGIADLFAYRALPNLASVKGSARVGEFRIILEEGRGANDWIDLRAFRIERISRRSSSDAA